MFIKFCRINAVLLNFSFKQQIKRKLYQFPQKYESAKLFLSIFKRIMGH